MQVLKLWSHELWHTGNLTQHSFRSIGFDTRPSFPGLYEYTREKWGRGFLAELAQAQQIEYLKWIDNCHVERAKLVQTLI